MKRTYLERMRRNDRDHALATVTRFMLGAAGVVAGLMFLRSLPDLIRYVKIERM